MALNTNVSKARIKAAVDAVVDGLDVGTGTAAVRVYSGAQPASPDVAINTATNVLLAEVSLDNPAFAAATTGTGAETSYIIALASGLPNTDTNANATGTAAWFRAVDRAGTAVIDGTVGVGTGFDMAIDNTSVAAGQIVKLNSWKIRLLYK